LRRLAACQVLTGHGMLLLVNMSCCTVWARRFAQVVCCVVLCCATQLAAQKAEQDETRTFADAMSVSTTADTDISHSLFTLLWIEALSMDLRN
jgi:hypothetical protein